MQFTSLSPFVPSGKDFAAAKQLFLDLGFTIGWDAGNMVSFQSGPYSFILQEYDEEAFAQNFMLSVGVPDAAAFYQEVLDKKLPEKYGIKISAPRQQPYGKEVNLIDIAGVCWHFIE